MSDKPKLTVEQIEGFAKYAHPPEFEEMQALCHYARIGLTLSKLLKQESLPTEMDEVFKKHFWKLLA